MRLPIYLIKFSPRALSHQAKRAGCKHTWHKAAANSARGRNVCERMIAQPTPPLYPQCNQSISALMLARTSTLLAYVFDSQTHTEREPRKSDTGAFLASASGFAVLNARRGQNAFGTSFFAARPQVRHRCGARGDTVTSMRRWCGVAEKNKKSRHIAHPHIYLCVSLAPV